MLFIKKKAENRSRFARMSTGDFPVPTNGPCGKILLRGEHGVDRFIDSKKGIILFIFLKKFIKKLFF